MRILLITGKRHGTGSGVGRLSGPENYVIFKLCQLVCGGKLHASFGKKIIRREIHFLSLKIETNL